MSEQSFPVLTKFQSLIESIEDKARQRVLRHFTDEERLQLFVEEADYAREFAKFQKQAEVLSSKPGQWKNLLAVPASEGVGCINDLNASCSELSRKAGRKVVRYPKTYSFAYGFSLYPTPWTFSISSSLQAKPCL